MRHRRHTPDTGGGHDGGQEVIRPTMPVSRVRAGKSCQDMDLKANKVRSSKIYKSKIYQTTLQNVPYNVIVQPLKIDRNHLCFCLSLCRWIWVQIGESRPEMFPWYIRAFNWKFPPIRYNRRERAEIENLFAFPISGTALWVSSIFALLLRWSWAHFKLSELIVSICLIVSLFIISKINLLFYISCGNLQKLDAVEDRRA